MNNFIDKFVCDDVDLDGNIIKIYYSDVVYQSNCFALIEKTYDELLLKGYATIPFNWKDNKIVNVLYGTKDSGEILSGIAYEYHPKNKEGWICLSFTDEKYRGKRINSIIHKHFEADIKKRGGQTISSHVHIDNKSRLAASNRVGYLPQFYRMIKKL